MKSKYQIENELFMKGQEVSFWERNHHVPSEEELADFIDENSDNIWNRWLVLIADKNRRKSHWAIQSHKEPRATA